MVTREWLLEEIERLQGLIGPAAVRLDGAERVYRRALTERNEAREDLKTLKACREEWLWQLAVMDEKEGAK